MNNYILVACLALSSMLFAQSPIEKGQAQINAGFGLSNYGFPVYAGFDYGVHPDISVGAEVSYRSYHEDYFNSNYDFSIIGISGNCNYHFNRVLNIPNKFDVYGGASVGFYIWNSPSGYGGNRASGLGLGLQIGGRYYFNDRIGVNLELGGGNATSGAKIGVSIKL